jgi:hypothetical protein
MQPSKQLAKFRRGLPLLAWSLSLLTSSEACENQADTAPPVAVAQAAEWKMEQIDRKDKKPLRGLVLRERKDEIEFIEIVRPKGKPMYLVVHHFDPSDVEQIARLEQSERKELFDRIINLLALKSRVQIEQLRMEDIELEEVVRDDELRWVFENHWFTLESTAGDESTRRCVIRIVRTFAAFRHMLPPRVTPEDKLKVVILGSMDEYRSRLKVSHPAFYERGTNTIYAASEMKRFARKLDQMRAQTKLRREQYKAFDKEMANHLALLSKELRKTGHTENEIQLEMRARTAAWQKKHEAIRSSLNQVDRFNENLFSQVSHEMFQRLKHEAFHAYFENYVFPHDRHDVPHWLNEGIAQLFEHAQLDNDQFRLDAPNPRLLKRLKADLSAGRALPLSELLRGDSKAFWASHNDRTNSNRYYLYAWGMAHYLEFDHDLFGGDKLAKFVIRGSENLSPAERLESLTNQSVEKLEDRWHKYIMNLKSEK